MAAGDITRALKVSGPTISQHLAVLRDAGLVSLRSEGTFRYYTARQEPLRSLRALLGDDPDRWVPSARSRSAVVRYTQQAAVIEIDAPCNQLTAFRAFTESALYSRWLGAPVSIEDGRFSATMEWGLEVRGTYEFVAPPGLIVMSWGFGLDVPLPGEELVAYLRILPKGARSHLVLHQLADVDAHVEKLGNMWALVLGRFRENIAGALKASSKSVSTSPARRSRK